MERLLDISSFQHSLFRTEIAFEDRKFKEVTVDHVMERCFVHLLSKWSDERQGKIYLLKNEVNDIYDETYRCTDDTGFLVKKFSETEIQGHGTSTIYALIRKHVKEILNKDIGEFELKYLDSTNDVKNFIVSVHVENITKLTFIFQINKGAADSTKIFCTFYSVPTKTRIGKLFSFFK